jgi:dTDP-glucose 4,6-dehydratase
MIAQPTIQVLVTGGAGFIGSNFIRFVRTERPRWRIINYDALTYAGNRDNLRDFEDDPCYTFIHGDVRDAAPLRAAIEGCDAVIHFAAESHVDRSIDDAAPFLTTNVIGTQKVLEACLDAGVQRIVHVGTDEVYGSLPLDRPDLKFSENSPISPNSPYAASKAAADLLALAFWRTHHLPVMVTRCSNNFGPHQFPEKVIPLFVTNLIDGQKVPLYGDGLNVRDWLHVLDHCEAILAVLESGRPGEMYNIGGDNERSNRELTGTILRIMECGEEMIQPVKDRPGHDRRYAIDSSKIQTELGWRPTRSAWPAALAETIEWYRANEWWWRPLKDHAFNATMLRQRDPAAMKR